MAYIFITPEQNSLSHGGSPTTLFYYHITLLSYSLYNYRITVSYTLFTIFLKNQKYMEMWNMF